jgi:hypothetical protein
MGHKKNAMSKDLTLTTAATPASMLQTAIEKGVDMSQIEKLMELYERWEANQARKKYYEALTTFQGLVPTIAKKRTAKTPNYSYKFADLGTITETIKKPLKATGLAFRWEIKEDAQIEVTCIISHKDGHTERTTMKGPKDNSGGKNLIQQSGSTLTYLQRYSLIGALGLATADDDNDAAGGAKGAGPAPETKGKKGKQQAADQTDQEYLQIWQESVNDCKNQNQLTNLYLQNRKTVDSDGRIQKIFKAHEKHLKDSGAAQPKTNLP